MKKHTTFLTGILGVLLVFGMVLMGCPNGTTDGTDGSSYLPEASGANALSGKTYFNDYEAEKIVFAATADDAASGSYQIFEVQWQDGSGPVLTNGKYTYRETQNGNYTWNETGKTVSLKPEKVSARMDGTQTGLLDKTGYRNAVQEMLNRYKEEMGEAAFNEQLASMGFSIVSAYIDYAVTQEFAAKTNGYSFATDGTALFLDEPLPENRGTNELAGQTFNGMTQDNNGQRVKDTSKVYVFTASGYTFTDSNYSPNNQTGTYTYDSSNSEYKRIYLKPTAINGRTREQYFESLSGNDTGYYSDATEYRAARTNGLFSIQEQEYNPTNKTVGWEN
jgi:hypothetical protein